MVSGWDLAETSARLVAARRDRRRSGAAAISRAKRNAEKRRATRARGCDAPDELAKEDLLVRVERLWKHRGSRGIEGQSRTSRRSPIVASEEKVGRRSIVDINRRSRENTRDGKRRERGRTLMISDRSWLISAWKANVSVSSAIVGVLRFVDGVCRALWNDATAGERTRLDCFYKLLPREDFAVRSCREETNRPDDRPLQLNLLNY